MPEEGDNAPDFSTTDADGTPVKLLDFRGQKVVLYFYPKDNPPGCTKEACSFRDSFSEFEKQGIKVLGVSLVSESAPKNFPEKYAFPFPLLADTDRSVSEA